MNEGIRFARRPLRGPLPNSHEMHIGLAACTLLVSGALTNPLHFVYALDPISKYGFVFALLTVVYGIWHAVLLGFQLLLIIRRRSELLINMSTLVRHPRINGQLNILHGFVALMVLCSTLLGAPTWYGLIVELEPLRTYGLAVALYVLWQGAQRTFLYIASVLRRNRRPR